MDIKEKLKIYELVNLCESTQGLINVIKSLTDEKGDIQGRFKKFSARKMIQGLEMYMEDNAPPELITREFGIRQQAMYIKHYKK